ncbi:ABC transporter ATP-binding protein [Enterocloster asparagiformis]|uniref:ABC transporter ATP-binding protein n=1 Tax=Enterocloster asparagiformis TaxID=333367 RepID=UPI0004B2B5F6|nr:ABC transporter ATP-binding protein [Enterocloster asparagiformis]
MSVITINHVTKSFGDVTVLKEFTEEFQDGEFITFLGPSGCGKTTMLRIIAGFEKPTTGEIRIDGKVVSSKDVFVPPEKRGIGMVFQSYAVWPHMNVFDNVAYPLKIQKVPKAEIKEKVEEILEIVHLSQYANRMPSQLSGGQQQRVALGRALIGQPKLLLLDEPLSNLDAKLRESMRFEIKEIQRKLKITVVYVTHDQVEAMTMSDRVFVINRGVVQQVGSPMEIYRRPKNQFIADFVGKVNFIKGQVNGSAVDLKGIGQSLAYEGPLTGDVVVAIRPENIKLTKPRAISTGPSSPCSIWGT